MLKIFKKVKFFKIISVFLVAIFAINVCSSCTVDHNGVKQNQNGGGNANVKIGLGNNIEGTMIYSESSFDKMTYNVYLGYLLSGKNFTLIVLPNCYDYDTNSSCVLSNDEDDGEEYYFNVDNYFYQNGADGVYEYDDLSASYVETQRKYLLYYVTQQELISWFEDAKKNDNFVSNVLEFAKSTTNPEKASRFKCENLVNLGSGLNAADFCGGLKEDVTPTEDESGVETTASGIIQNGTGIFNNVKTGGMVLFFGMSSIEGYFTYNQVMAYEGSSVANTFQNCSYPDTSGIKDIVGYGSVWGILSNEIREEYDIKSINIQNISDSEKQDIMAAYTDQLLSNAAAGCESFQKSYVALNVAYKISSKSSEFSGTNGSTMKNYLESALTLKSFNDAKESEEFNIKFSVALQGRYDYVNEYISVADMSQSYTSYSVDVELNKNSSALATAKTNVQGNEEINDGNYLVLVTSDGFVLDRGDADTQISTGAWAALTGSDDWGFMSYLVTKDSCANANIASYMFNMLANLKIYVGTGLIIGGAAVAIAAGVGLAVAGVIGKLAILGACAPVPGARIVALVLAVVAGLIALGVGIATLISGLSDKARLKGLGASETNYCETYAATFNKLFESSSLPVPIYHYEVEESSTISKDLSLNYCPDEYEYDSESGKCISETVIPNSKEPVTIQLFNYADLDVAEELDLSGSPVLMYFRNGEMVDYIVGASTPEYILETLRIWGLLAIDDYVYQFNEDSTGKNYVLTHVNNENARTVRITNAKSCISLEYKIDTYNDESFCYDSVQMTTDKYYDGVKYSPKYATGVTVLSKSKEELENVLKSAEFKAEVDNYFGSFENYDEETEGEYTKTYSIYYSSTVKEYAQATSYDNKTCDTSDNEFVFERNGKKKCISIDKAKSSDVPIASTDPTYYNASITIGQLSITFGADNNIKSIDIIFDGESLGGGNQDESTVGE